MSEKRTYSISIRLRRTSVEEAFVSVPVEPQIMHSQPDEKGSFHIDPDKVVAQAVLLGRDPATVWTLETQPMIEPHPIQMAPPELRKIN